MTWWKILTSPGGAAGTRASVISAMERNLRREGGGATYRAKADAIQQALTLRYRVIFGKNHNIPTGIEAKPLAYESVEKLPALVAEYIVAQEHPGRDTWMLGLR